jgi:hypothetical protein
VAGLATGGDDDALIGLVRRDPRYLGSELLQARILLWNLQALLGEPR